jgi:hypothetical protein
MSKQGTSSRSFDLVFAGRRWGEFFIEVGRESVELQPYGPTTSGSLLRPSKFAVSVVRVLNAYELFQSAPNPSLRKTGADALDALNQVQQPCTEGTGSFRCETKLHNLCPSEFPPACGTVNMRYIG